MFVECLCDICTHSNLVYTKDDMSDVKCVCPAYPEGIPDNAPGMQEQAILLKYDPIPPCPKGMRFKMRQSWIERCQAVIDAQEGRRSWNGIEE